MRLVSAIAMLAFAVGIGHCAGQILNMSHDLVTKGIASRNLTPNTPSLDARPLFQAALAYVAAHPVQTLTLDQGNYYLLTPQQSSAALVIPSLSNMTIDLAGSTFYFNSTLLSSGFDIYFCSNLTFTNFQTDYLSPPYTHVQITSVDTVNRLIHYQTISGWPDPSTFNTLVDPYGGTVQFWAALFRNGSVIPGTSRTALTPPFANATLVLTQDSTPWTQAPTLATLQAGDTVVVTARAGGPPIQVWQGNSITVSNGNIYGSNQFAMNLYETSDSVVDNVNVMPRPVTGLVGSNADGIHFVSTYQNNHIRNSYVTRTMDDALIMDSSAQATIVRVNGSNQITVTRNGYDRFPDGTAVNFVDPASTTEFTGSTIIAQNPPDSTNPVNDGQVVLTFSSSLPALSPGQFMVYGSPGMRGAGSTFEDNVVEDTILGKGIWMNGLMNVTAARNVIRRTAEGGISVSQDTDAFPAPPVNGITITDNSLEGAVGPAAPGTGVADSLGAIQVISTNDNNFSFATASSNSNVSILNNFIIYSGRSGLWIGELSGGTLENNVVIASNQTPTLGGLFGIPTQFQSQVTQDSTTPIVIRYSTGVAQTGDTVSAISSFTAPVIMTPSSVTLTAAAQSAGFSLETAVTGFAWTASSDSTWLIVSSNFAGPGSGTVEYSVSANTTGAARTGHIGIAGEVFTVTQALAAVTVSTVVSAASGQIGIAANSWITITGTNLSNVTDTWANSIINGVLPTTLDGVSVSVGGVPAYIDYVSPTQVNALAPNVMQGTAQVTVTNSNVASAPVTASTQIFQPAFFQWGNYAVATRADYSLAVANGTFSGVTTIPSKPGDVIVFWGTGFGPTNPSTPEGKVTPSATYNTANAVSVSIGGLSATVLGAVLTPGSVGLYQIAVEIPSSLTNADYPVVASVAGAQSPSTTLITVQK
jgi:uncharacterized protein (TIGR03437 family)